MKMYMLVVLPILLTLVGCELDSHDSDKNSLPETNSTQNAQRSDDDPDQTTSQNSRIPLDDLTNFLAQLHQNSDTGWTNCLGNWTGSTSFDYGGTSYFANVVECRIFTQATDLPAINYTVNIESFPSHALVDMAFNVNDNLGWDASSKSLRYIADTNDPPHYFIFTLVDLNEAIFALPLYYGGVSVPVTRVSQ